MSERDQGVSRRTFLTYTLMGTGGFFAATLLTPMLRFAVDPALKASESANMTAVGSVSEFTAEPKRVNFKVKVIDGWYKDQETLSAWVTKKGDNFLALSPICKHLGCTVNWNPDPKTYPNKYVCPCHGGRFEINGKNVPHTPPPLPLDEYTTQVKDGKLYLGQIVPNRILKEA